MTSKLFQNITVEDLEWFFRTPSMNNKIARYPLTNLGVDKDDNLVIEIAIAGFAKEDIEIEQKGNRLIISAKNDKEESDLRYLQRNISVSPFERVIILHDMYVDGTVEADLKDGILKIFVRPVEQKKTLIDIK